VLLSDLRIQKRHLAANPDSAEALRDLLVSLERLSLAQAGRAGGEQAALALQRRSLELALRLQRANAGSYFFARTAAISFLLTCERAKAAGQQELAAQCLAGCFAILDGLVKVGAALDPEMQQLHGQLRGMSPG
jgi:hypothetical protein